MKLIALRTLVPLIACLAVPLAAQSTAEMLAQSEDLADDARAAMDAGDRRAAIIAALMGLPDTPDEADLAAYPEAYVMLFRAMAARIVPLERQPTQYNAVNADGTRAIAMSMYGTVISAGTSERVIELDPDTREMVVRGGPEGLPLEDEPPHILVDPRTGEVIADLLPFAATMDMVFFPALPAAFSPDGTQVALWQMSDGHLLRFDAQDGAPFPPLTDLAGCSAVHVMGYSPDGTRIAAKAGEQAAIWDVDTGALIETMALPLNYVASDWTHTGQLMSLNVEGYEGEGEAALSVWQDGRWEEIMSLTGRAAWANQYIQVSKHGPHILFDNYLVDYATYNVIELGPSGAAFHRFALCGWLPFCKYNFAHGISSEAVLCSAC